MDKVKWGLLTALLIGWLGPSFFGPSYDYRRLRATVPVIWRVNGSRFGISARRRLPNGAGEQLTHSGDIEWYDTLEECKARAEHILHDHQVRVH
jgi:hypothetical protein